MVTDAETTETIIGAIVQFNPNLKAKTDFDGAYIIENVPFGEYTVEVSMATYKTKTFTLTVSAETPVLILC